MGQSARSYRVHGPLRQGWSLKDNIFLQLSSDSIYMSVGSCLESSGAVLVMPIV